jgi:hypothetical protein
MNARRAFLLYSALVGLALAWMVHRSPLQVGDNYDRLVGALRGSIGAVVTRHGDGTYRPAGELQARALARLFEGREAEVFRGVLAAQVALQCVLFAIVLRVDSRRDLAAGTLALAVFLGHQAFRPTVMEAFPINHFGFVTLCCLAALLMARGRPQPLTDALVPVLGLLAIFTVESGVLVLLLFLAARALGFPGVSRRAAILAILALAAYAVVRFAVLPPGGGVPSLGGHRSGFGTSVLEPDEIQARFGGTPALWFAHNVGVAIASTLLSEPQEGRWTLPDTLSTGALPLRQAVELASAAVLTAIILWAVVRSVRRREDAGRQDARLFALCGILGLAGAGLCYRYVKNDILSAAAMFYAIAAYVAVRAALGWSMATTRRVGALAVAVLLASLAVAWSLRVGDLACEIRYRAFAKRNEWAIFGLRPLEPHLTSAERDLGLRMRRSFVDLRVPSNELVEGTFPCVLR